MVGGNQCTSPPDQCTPSIAYKHSLPPKLMAAVEKRSKPCRMCSLSFPVSQLRTVKEGDKSISLCIDCQGLFAAPTTADEVSNSSDDDPMSLREAPLARKRSAKTSQVVQIGAEQSTASKRPKDGGKRRGAADTATSNTTEQRSSVGQSSTKQTDHDSSYDESGTEDGDEEQESDGKGSNEDEVSVPVKRRRTKGAPARQAGLASSSVASAHAAATVKQPAKAKRLRTQASTKAVAAGTANDNVDDEDQSGDVADTDPHEVRHQSVLESIRGKWQEMHVEASQIIIKSRRELVDEFNAPAIQQARLAVSKANEKLRVAGLDPAHACAESDLVDMLLPPLLLKSICASCKHISIDEEELLLYFAISLQLGVLGKTADSFVAASPQWHAHMPRVFTGPQSEQIMTLIRFKQIQRWIQVSTPVLPQDCPLHAFDSFLQAKTLHSMVLETIAPMVSAALDDNMLPTQGRSAPCKKMSLRKTYPSGVVMDFVVASFLAIPLACRFRLTGESAQTSALNMLTQVVAIDGSNIRLILDRGFGSIVLALMFASRANSLFAIVNDGDKHFPIGSEEYRKFHMPEGRGVGCHEVQVCWLPADAKTNPSVILAIAVREGAGKSGSKKDTKLLKMVSTESGLVRYVATYARIPWVVDPHERKYDLINTSLREKRTVSATKPGAAHAAAGANRDGSSDLTRLDDDDGNESDNDSSFVPSVASSDDDRDDSDLARSESDWSSQSDDDGDSKSEGDLDMYRTEEPADYVSDTDSQPPEEQKLQSRVDVVMGAPLDLAPADGGIPTSEQTAHAQVAALRRAIEVQCNILTETQREASWHALRRFHLTGTSVYPILNKYKMFRAKKGKSPQMAFWKILFSCWFDSRKRATPSMKLGHVNESRVIDALAARPDLSTVRTVGLLESKAHPFLAISPDGMCMYKGHMTPIEIKTKTSRATEADAEFLAARYCSRSAIGGPDVRDVALSDEDVFHTLVPSAAYRMQLMHSLLTTGATGILFVAAALAPKDPLIYILHITVHSARCKAVLRTFKAELLDLASFVRFHEVFKDAHVPACVPTEHYQSWRTHVKFFVGLRNHALKQPVPPTRTFKHALQVLYNTGKGGVDIVSRHEQTIEGNDSRRVSFDHLVANRAVQDSLLAAWAVRKSALTLAHTDSQKLTATTLREKNNRHIDLVDFVERVSLQWLQKATARRSGMTARQTYAHVERLAHLHMEFDTPRSKRGLEFFNSSVGLELRAFDGPHDLEPAGKQNWCVLGHCGSTNKRGSKTTSRCKTCRAALCDTCHVKFHSDRNRRWVRMTDDGPSPDALNTPASVQRPAVSSAASAVPQTAVAGQAEQVLPQLASPSPVAPLQRAPADGSADTVAAQAVQAARDESEDDADEPAAAAVLPGGARVMQAVVAQEEDSQPEVLLLLPQAPASQAMAPSLPLNARQAGAKRRLADSHRTSIP